jgi:hypothetical protein
MQGFFMRSMAHVTLLAVLPMGAGVAQSPGASRPVSMPTLASADDRPPAEVLLLGVFHLSNPNADVVQFKGIDVREARRQAEIMDVVDRLSGFRPTVVAVEDPPSRSGQLDRDLAAFRRGDFVLTTNEIHQLGFRLANQAQLARVIPVDYRMGFAADTLMQYAATHEPALAARFGAYIGRIQVLLDSLQTHATIRENLLFLNEPVNVTSAHEPYVVLATLGAGGTHLGAELVARWYQRNLAIFANLATVAKRGERVILIIGAGHVPILRELVIAHPDMRLVDVTEYLR